MTGFKSARISEFCVTGSGGTPSRSQVERYYEGGTIPWVKSGELRETVIKRTSEYVTETALKESSIKLVPAGAILLAMYGATVGRLGILGIEATTNQAVCHIVPDPKVAEIRYIFHAISHQVPSLIAKGVGGAQPNINQAIIKDVAIPLPPLPEQCRIAAILDQADALRAKRREALKQLDSLTQSIFIEMFGDSLRSNIRHALSNLIEDFRYGTSNKSGASGYPALRIPNVTSGSLDLTELKTVAVDDSEFQRLKLRDGDLLFVRTNGNPDYVGRCAVFNPLKVLETGFKSSEFIYASYLISARLKESTVLSIVLQEYLSTAEGRRALRARCKTSAGQFNINTEGLGSLPIPSFPMPLQESFIRKKKTIEQQQAIHRESLAELDALFASLQHRAFRGEL